MASTTKLAISCPCGAVSSSLTVSTADLPLRTTLCHCTTCRHQTGLLAGSYTELPSSVDIANAISSPTLTEYKSSSACSRWFCFRCGANVYFHSNDYGTSVCSGLLSAEPPNLPQSCIKLDSHIFVSDTKDGGLSTWLPRLPTWSGLTGISTRLDDSAPAVSSTGVSSTSKSALSNSLQAYCACRGVSFHMTRPDATSIEPKNAPLSNLFAPYSKEYFPAAPSPSDPPLKLPIKENERDVKWWLSPLSPSSGEQQQHHHHRRYLAGICVCAFCRVYSGFEFQVWTYVPLSNIFPTLPSSTVTSTVATGQVEDSPAKSSLTLPPPPGVLTTLKSYQSSPEVQRWFCGRCGATCFWQGQARPGVIDVSVGLLDATNEEGGGSRAETWLDWRWQRVSFEEEAEGWEVLNDLKEGLKAWGENGLKSS